MERREVEFRSLDGSRCLMAEDTGPLDGTVLIFHAGTPGTRVMPEWWLREAHDRGIRHVAYSRPAHEGSERMVGRAVASCGDDVLALIETLGADRVYNVGGSGGGPHALAFAAGYPERVLATAAVACVAPTDAEGLDWEAGMSEENCVELAARRAGDETLIEHLTRAVEAILRGGGEDMAFGESMSAADRAVMVGRMAALQAKAVRRVFADGIWGCFDDEMALWDADWGFDLDAVGGRLAFWQGGDDLMVPADHGHWFAKRLPGADYHFLPDAGHVSIFEHHYGAILDFLIVAAEPPR